MSKKLTILERAFAIAESGAVESLDGIKERLLGEGFADGDLQQLDGVIPLRQLTGMIASARAAKTTAA